ncbi:DUF916 and DUF3324 domain-containing protein [Lacticaseibacillus baoqingensis]|nr:DUF916 and DUF3324 domain-containing protein [Lacticaseibacillus baoqingensis]
MKTWLAALIAVVGLGLVQGHLVHAANTGAQYTVSPVIPENHRTGVSSYFDLVVKPGTTQPLTLAVTNQTSSPRHLRLSLTTAYTQSNGMIAYKPNGPKDPSAQYRLTDLGQPTQTVDLAGGQTKQVTVNLKIPAQGFKGVLLGSLYLVDTQKTNGDTSGGVKFKNQFATVVGVQLQTSDTAMDQVKKELQLTGVSAGIQNGKPGVIATVQNPTPTFWGKMRLQAKVTKRNSSAVVMKRTVNGFTVAPNSHFDYGILQNKALDPGDYSLDLLITGPHGRWHFKRNFSILAAEADKINRTVHMKRAFSLPWWAWLLIGIASVGLLWLIVTLIRRHQQHKTA